MAYIQGALGAIRETYGTKILAEQAAQEAAARREAASAELNRWLQQAGEEVKDHLLENGVEPDVEVVTPAKRRLWGLVIPPLLVLRGWTITSSSAGEEGNIDGRIKGEFVPLLMRHRVVLSTDGHFYDYSLETPLHPSSTETEPLTRVYLMDNLSNVNGATIADGLARLVASTEAASQPQPNRP